ncbi:hypothetical protein BY996DRAFT_6456850 [Phakopsora pachyrhizi]|nr:hypothetical protein BY996DRAFT_6456850 [Phakopsora pachyrhizi]
MQEAGQRDREKGAQAAKPGTIEVAGDQRCGLKEEPGRKGMEICIKRLMIKLPASSNMPKNVFGLLKAPMENFCKAYIKTGLGTRQLQLSLFEQAEEVGLQTQKCAIGGLMLTKDLAMYQDTTSRIEIINLNNRHQGHVRCNNQLIEAFEVKASLMKNLIDWDVGYEELPNISWIELSKGSKLAAALLDLRLKMMRRQQETVAGMVEDLSKEIEEDQATWSDSINSNNRSTNNNSFSKNCVKHKTKRIKIWRRFKGLGVRLIGLGQTVIAIWKRPWRDPIRPEQPKSLSVRQILEELQRMADLRTVSEKDLDGFVVLLELVEAIDGAGGV